MQKSIEEINGHIKYQLRHLRLEKRFMLDTQKTIKDMYNSIERTSRPRIQNPFPKLTADIKESYKSRFGRDLLITHKDQGINEKRLKVADNIEIHGKTKILPGRTGRAYVMSPLSEKDECKSPDSSKIDRCVAGLCFDSYCPCHPSESELSFYNAELEIERELYREEENSKKKM